jgi:methyl-accepting chemotaxis protein
VAETAGQVSEASVEIASGARGFAEGSSEQAGALKEVSSSLEEMSLMIKRNADNSNNAKILASEAYAAAREGDIAMKRMVAAIEMIKRSSDDTEKIVKIINDISYETGLLSHKAAVEAIRAGEAGRGFAVVAGEARCLAKRSVEAVKNIAVIIGESIKNTDAGVEITESVAASFAKIVARSGKTGGFIADIAAASSEQAHGIKLVNDFLAYMNQVNHRIAADSCESAGAAAELNDRAAELADLVESFTLSGSAERYRAAEAATETEVAVKANAGTAIRDVCVNTARKRLSHTAHRSVRVENRRKHHSLIKYVRRAARAMEMVMSDSGEFKDVFD